MRVFFGIFAMTLASLALFKCVSSPGSGDPPTDVQVDPSSGQAGVSHQVTIKGSGFRPEVHQNASCGTETYDVNDQFEAEMGGAVLADVVWRDEQTLTATIPAGLREGFHTLLIVDPSGNAVEFEDAFEITGSSDGDTDIDADTDSDSDSDTDADADTDTGTDTDPDFLCDDTNPDAGVSECQGVCSAGGCNMVCLGSEDCHLTCNPGNCDLQCLGTGNCIMNCSSGDCTGRSTSPYELFVTCTGGNCDIQCDGSGRCWLQGPQSTNSMTGCAATMCPNPEGMVCNGPCE